MTIIHSSNEDPGNSLCRSRDIRFERSTTNSEDFAILGPSDGLSFTLSIRAALDLAAAMIEELGPKSEPGKKQTVKVDCGYLAPGQLKKMLKGLLLRESAEHRATIQKRLYNGRRLTMRGTDEQIATALASMSLNDCPHTAKLLPEYKAHAPSPAVDVELG